MGDRAASLCGLPGGSFTRWPGERNVRQREFALCVLAAFVAAGCARISPEPPAKTGNQAVRRPQGRTLAELESKLDKTLTPIAAKARLGKPDKITGSGLLIYVYVLGDGREVWMGFPGYAPIMYAKVKAKDGSVMDLKLR